MGRACGTYGDRRDPKMVLEGRFEGNIRFGNPRR